MSDLTESVRRTMLQRQQTTGPASREALEQAYGRVWDTSQLSEDFEVIGFLAPFVVVRRKSDGQKGSLTFQHSPRFYFDFVEDR
jgi:hypothetical protein